MAMRCCCPDARKGHMQDQKPANHLRTTERLLLGEVGKALTQLNNCPE
jgi:hypothetical protein